MLSFFPALLCEKGLRSLIVGLMNNSGSISFEQGSTWKFVKAFGSTQFGDFANATGVLDEGRSRSAGSGLVAIECSRSSQNVERATDIVLLQGVLKSGECLGIFEVRVPDIGRSVSPAVESCGLETSDWRCVFESWPWELRERRIGFLRRNHHIPTEVFGNFDTRV